MRRGAGFPDARQLTALDPVRGLAVGDFNGDGRLALTTSVSPDSTDGRALLFFREWRGRLFRRRRIVGANG